METVKTSAVCAVWEDDEHEVKVLINKQNINHLGDIIQIPRKTLSWTLVKDDSVLDRCFTSQSLNYLNCIVVRCRDVPDLIFGGFLSLPWFLSASGFWISSSVYRFEK